MNRQMSAIPLMGLLMSRTSLEIGTVFQLVQILNKSYFQCQKVITILQEIYAKQKSGKILLAVQVTTQSILDPLVFNQELQQKFSPSSKQVIFSKKSPFTIEKSKNKRIQIRGKTNFLSDLRSNSDNWNKIQAKILYLIQLWYDAFILEESVYNNIIDTYKILRKENILFPPRSSNEKNIIFVKTQSPILQNIEEIARSDQQKFSKKLNNMGMSQAFKKIEKFEAVQQQKRLSHKIDLDQISEKIAIVRSNGYEGSEMIKLIQQIRKDLEFGKVDSSQQKYWKDIKEAAENLISQWQEKNVEIIQQHERKYLEMKLGKVSLQKQKPQESIKPIIVFNSEQKKQIKYQQPIKVQFPKQEQFNLIDL